MAVEVYCTAPMCRKWVSSEVPCEEADIHGRQWLCVEDGTYESEVGCRAYEAREETEPE